MKNIHVITILAALMMTFAACTEKEKVDNEVTTRQEQRLTVTYTVDAEPNHVTLKSVAAYRSLVGDLVGKTREGREISVVLDNVEFRTVPTKSIDTVLVSDSLELVMEWIERMNYSGYDVLVRYDETTGTYHCKAQMPNDPMYQHVWQCDSNGFTIRLTFWNDSILYSEVYDDDHQVLYIKGNKFFKYQIINEEIFASHGDFRNRLYLLRSLTDSGYSAGDIIVREFIIDTLPSGKIQLDANWSTLDKSIDSYIFEIIY